MINRYNIVKELITKQCNEWITKSFIAKQIWVTKWTFNIFLNNTNSRFNRPTILNIEKLENYFKTDNNWNDRYIMSKNYILQKIMNWYNYQYLESELWYTWTTWKMLFNFVNSTKLNLNVHNLKRIEKIEKKYWEYYLTKNI